jgi:N utilization substance protein B
MSTRRETREWIVQLLYQLDMNSKTPLEGVFRHFWADKKVAPKARQFVESCVTGVKDHLVEIDATIQKCTENWDLSRMAAVDRNVLRMAAHEILYRSDIPTVVSINEAVDLAKYFSNRESGKFVNGILDRIRKSTQPKPAANP